MRALVALLFFFAQPFWEAKPPEKWSNAEIDMLRSNSPWAQRLGPDPAVLVYLATAAPLVEAEAELRLRGRNPLREPDPDYAAHISANRDRHLVLAIPYRERDMSRLGKAGEDRKLENETLMIVGRRSHKIIGHFPPTASDPVLRLVFPRDVQETDKSVVFRLYLPGIDFPEREIEFRVKELIYRGRVEM
jgi:hypothetical protein